MKLPKNFEWIGDILETSPKMIVEGLNLLGVAEIKGQKSNPVILGFAKEIGVDDIYKNDDTSWCALSHNYIALKSGKPIYGYKDKYDLLRALAFGKNGVEINKDEWVVVKNSEAAYGDSLLFKRPGGGHIGLYIGESKTHYIVMGGNQNNMYSFTRIAKERLVAVRRPKYKATPASVKKYFLDNSGLPATTNEA